MSSLKSLGQLTAAIAAAGLATALTLTPLAVLGGAGVSRAEETMDSNLTDLTEGSAPGVTTINDAAGESIAWIYKQRRFDVPSNQIAKPMKQAIVSVEDRRFYEHEGVDWKGALRAMGRNIIKGAVSEGASTIDQQYVKNYLLLVDAEDEAEQQLAVEQSIPRKLREMRMASDLDRRHDKDEILARYLNIVPFGNGAYGVEAASRTYFGIHASELSVAQAAMLAGIVQSSSLLDPYTNPEGVAERRATVLDTMVESGAITIEQAQAIKQEPLGVLEQPQGLPNGCIAAGDRGFFCDYVLDYLSKKGLDFDEVATGGYTIDTTLDPATQEAARQAVTSQVSPTTPGVAEVMNVVEPGEKSRKVVAMASSRDYGLDLDAGQTVLPQPFTRVGAGAGSVFKVFTAAVALEKGMGVDTMVDVPPRFEARGMGDGGAKNCPPGTYCVENSGVYKPQMTLKQALAQSPNTTFVKLIEQLGVSNVVDMSVNLGLRDYVEPGSFDGASSIAEYVKSHNLGSYTLGPTAVNPLELANVSATIASGGMWCEPSPINKVLDRHGQAVDLDIPDCERAVPENVAAALANALSEDVVDGTAADAAKAAGWGAPTAAKTGTTESHFSAAFMGFNSRLAAVPYVYNDGVTPTPLCTSPLRQCPDGDLYGGMEPARTWFAAARGIPDAADGVLPAMDPKFGRGLGVSDLPSVRGLSEGDARKRLEKAGYKVSITFVPGDGMPRGRVVGIRTGEAVMQGDTLTLELSDGSTRPSAPPSPAQPEDQVGNDVADDLGAVIDDLLRSLGAN